jgi:2-aminoadipate transaminase
VSTGSQQMLFLLSDVLLDPGDVVITAWPSYFVYTGTLEALGAEVRCVEMDSDGIRPDSLRGLLSTLKTEGKLPRVKIVYVVSYHQNPTGITLSADRREEILDIVRSFSIDHRICLIEDAAYRELTYDGQVPPSIRSYDTQSRHVALLQTFSKPFSPGLKTGYALLPDDLVEPVIIQKGNHDFGSANFVQEILLGALESGVYQAHLQRICAAYARKRDAMLEALDEQFGRDPDVHWTCPHGGLYVWLTLPEAADTSMDSPLCTRAIREGMLYVPGEFCFPPDPTRQRPTCAIRLSFGVAGPERIREGIARLARAYRGGDYASESRPTKSENVKT